MTPLPNPTTPVLASTLLDRERSHLRSDGSPHSWQTGIPSLDETLPPSLWSSGKVIGVIDTTGDGGDVYDDGYQSGRESVSRPPDPGPRPGSKHAYPLLTHILINHLASLPPTSPSPSPRISTLPSISLLIPPLPTLPLTSPLSPNTLSAALTHLHLQPYPPHPYTPTTLLSQISLLQYLDIAGLMDALAEVSAQSHQTQNSHSPSSSDTSQSHAHPGTRKIIALSSLSPLLTRLSQTSGRISALAQLKGVMRALTHLARSNTDMLVLVQVDVDEKGGGGGGGGAGWFVVDEVEAKEGSRKTGIGMRNGMRSAFHHSSSSSICKSLNKPTTSDSWAGRTTHSRSHPTTSTTTTINTITRQNNTLLRSLLEGIDRLILEHRVSFANSDYDGDTDKDALANTDGDANTDGNQQQGSEDAQRGKRRRGSRDRGDTSIGRIGKGATRECEIVEVIHDRVGGLEGVWAVR